VKKSLRIQVSNDIKAAKKLWLPWWAVLAIMVIIVPIFPLFDHFGKLNMALPLFNCVSVFCLLIYLKWDLRRQPLFWAVIVLLVALHAALIWYIPWTSRWTPAVAIAVISSIDFCFMLWVLAVVELLLHRQAMTKS